MLLAHSSLFPNITRIQLDRFEHPAFNVELLRIFDPVRCQAFLSDGGRMCLRELPCIRYEAVWRHKSDGVVAYVTHVDRKTAAQMLAVDRHLSPPTPEDA